MAYLLVVLCWIFITAHTYQFNITDFLIYANDTQCSNDQFCLRIYNDQQTNFPVFSTQQYYKNSKVPFIILSQASLSTNPVINGEPQDFVNTENIILNSTDITVDTIYQSQTTHCVHIEGSILFNNQQLPSVSYQFSVCPSDTKMSCPYYNNNTCIQSQNSLDWYISFDVQKPTIINRIFFSYDSEADEALFGFGVQYSFLNFKGKKLPIFTSEQGVGRGLEPVTSFLNEFAGGAGGSWYTTYSATPLYISTLNRSLLLFDYDISIFNMENDEYIQIELYCNDSLSMNGRIIYGDEPLKMIQELTLVTGRMDPLPEWSQQGGILGIEGGTEFVLENVKKIVDHGVYYKKYNLSMIGLWIQDWSGTIKREIEGTRLLWNWELNTIKYPYWSEMQTNLSKYYGVDYIMTYVNPYLVNISAIYYDIDKYGYRHNFYNDAAKFNYFMKNATNQTWLVNSPPFEFATMDFDNKDACTWFQQQIIKQNMLNESKTYGWMTDFGEYLPFDAYLSNDQLVNSSLHNYYPLIYSKTVRDAINPEIVPFHRSSNLFSTKYARLFWLGDQLVTWDSHDGIKSVLYGLFSGGISGHSLSHSDIGGYTMIQEKDLFSYLRDCELLMRWMELSAFSDGIYRSHPGNEPTKSCQIYTNNQTIEHYYKFTSVFKGLRQYRKDLMNDAYNYGYPMVRHLYLHYWNDKTVLDVVKMKKTFDDDDYHRNRNTSYSIINEEFLLGDCMLVAPILYSNVTSRMVYLPEGEWTNYWDGNEVISSKGDFYERQGPMGQPPVFVCQQWKYSLH